ncbi:MAG: FAD:protein FMN transferase [Thermoguttaceae bacterium]|nr:FAD:protein FMN transferase [Thermoguttaceae bacterium]
MAAKQKQLKNDTKSVPNDDQPQQGGFLNGTIRIVLVIILVAYMLKPYIFDKPQTGNSELQNFVVHGNVMGTTWNAVVCANANKLIEINSSDKSSSDETVDSCEVLLARIIQRKLDQVDRIASTYRLDSEISKFNSSQSTEWFDVSPETAEIVSIAQKVAKNTNGAFDVTVAPLVNLYRFGPNKSPLVALPSDEQIDAVKQNVGYANLEVRMEPKPGLKKSIPALTIDLSGVAKGYAVDLAGKELEELGLDSYMLEVGGEIRCSGEKVDPDTLERKPWALGIQTPEVVVNEAASHTPEVYRLVNFSSYDHGSALATSGDYQNFLQVGSVRFSHIVDPRTGKPTEIVDENDSNTERLGSVSVLSNSCDELSCAEADAYATAFFVLGVKEGPAIAEKLGTPVLFLVRKDDSAKELSEVFSSAFSSFDSKTLEQIKDEMESQKKPSK